MAAGNAVLDVMLEPGFFDKRRGDALGLLRGRLDELVESYPKLFAELRGSGLLLGIRCVVPAGDVVAKLRENGLLALTAGDNVLRLLPPLIVGEARDRRGDGHPAQGGAGMAGVRRRGPRGHADRRAARAARCRATFSISTGSTAPSCAAFSISASPTSAAGATGRSPARPWR